MTDGDTHAAVMAALGEVRDPELDEPITALRFVDSCTVSPDGAVELALRLPTPQCAPNFAFMMAADAREVVRRLPSVRSVAVRLLDHYTGDEINAAVAAGDGFDGAFPGETESGDLQSLRSVFLRKALVARQSRICERMLAAGATELAVTSMTTQDLRDTPDGVRCLELRGQLGIRAEFGDPAFVTPDGKPIAAQELSRWLRIARLVRMSIDVNGGICRSLLAHRYDLDQPDARGETGDMSEIHDGAPREVSCR